MSARPSPARSPDAAPDPSLAVLKPPTGVVRWMRELMLRHGRWRTVGLVTLMALVLAVSFTALVRWAIGATGADFWRGLGIAGSVALIITPMCCAHWLSLLDYQMHLEQSYRALAMGDLLTGVPNRRWILAQGERAGVLDAQALSVLLIDIDRFKVVNERHGHRIGDAVLHHVAQVLSGQLRRGEFIGRFGAEEFLVLTTDATAQALVEHAERLRIAVAAAPLKLDGEVYAVTVSVGGATMAAERSADRFNLAIREADVALHEAKRQGRNRVRLAPPRAMAAMPPWTRRTEMPGRRTSRGSRIG